MILFIFYKNYICICTYMFTHVEKKGENMAKCCIHAVGGKGVVSE